MGWGGGADGWLQNGGRGHLYRGGGCLVKEFVLKDNRGFVLGIHTNEIIDPWHAQTSARHS